MKVNKNSIDIDRIPFSCYGSYFVISLEKNKLYVRNIRGGDMDSGRIFECVFSEAVTIMMTESLLSITGKSGILDISFVNEDTLSFRGNLKVKLNYILKRYDTICQLSKDFHEITSYSKEIKIGIKHEKGTMNVKEPWDAIGNTKIEILAESYYQFYMCSYKTVFNESIIHHKSHGYTYDHWSALLPEDNTAAKYITWMNFVKPEGNLKRYAMYMSKNWMTNIWSWDNCFSAIFLSHLDSDLALDQYLMFSDHQDRSGMYPDFVNDQYVSYSCAKPPIYGWAYEMMMQINPVFNNITLLEKVYDTVSKLTKFWQKHRMSDIGLPFYVHGNESGWDNGTFFAAGMPMVTPDLSSYLIRQLDFLSKIALDLGMQQESNRLKEQADQLFKKMMDFLWQGDRFDGYHLTKEMYVEGHNTLQSYLPLIIHYRLPEAVKNILLNSLKEEGVFLSEFGLATESLKSHAYKQNGYWRGPIWAPIMMIMSSIMEELKEDEFLETIVTRFYHCMKENGMAENFDPKKGTGLKDQAFAWTSSTYLHYLIKYDFLKRD